TTLRILTQQENVSRIAALFSDTSGGAFPTSSLRKLLALDSLRMKAVDVENVVVVPGSADVELAAVLAVRGEGTSATSMDALVFSPGPKSLSLVLHVAGDGEKRPSARLDADLAIGYSVQQFQFAPPLGRNVLAAAAANLEHDETIVVPVPR